MVVLSVVGAHMVFAGIGVLLAEGLLQAAGVVDVTSSAAAA